MLRVAALLLLHLFRCAGLAKQVPERVERVVAAVGDGRREEVQGANWNALVAASVALGRLQRRSDERENGRDVPEGPVRAAIDEREQMLLRHLAQEGARLGVVDSAQQHRLLRPESVVEDPGNWVRRSGVETKLKRAGCHRAAAVSKNKGGDLLRGARGDDAFVLADVLGSEQKLAREIAHGDAVVVGDGENTGSGGAKAHQGKNLQVLAPERPSSDEEDARASQLFELRQTEQRGVVNVGGWQLFLLFVLDESIVREVVVWIDRGRRKGGRRHR